MIDTGSPVSLLKEKLSPVESIPYMLPGIKGTELIILNQAFVDIYRPDTSDPINVKLNIVPDNTINYDCFLGGNFLSHPRIIFTINNGDFGIEIKRNDIITCPYNTTTD
ncbi:unnamed protein product [Macrosiphum euphorbiae]|uniref:Peptidase A2 domain-containing protein n=1 Tax=Macrosiphum euphorbiae TaxID=13131 RepID=A0AAV0VYF8_9HEMI|nr:unnamed protein product [Macrosiphum euphorbiae]